MATPKYYSLDKILKTGSDCLYYMLIGERSNGKTYSVLQHMIENYFSTGKQFAIIRRWLDDFRGKRGAQMFDAINKNNVILNLSHGDWDGIFYYSMRFYLYRMEGDKRILSENPIGFCFALSTMEHDKSTSYDDITIVFFDEFLTRQMYLPNEFILFMNVLSTIIRMRNDVKIFMAGNTVNQYSPYFSEFGLSNIKKMKKGDIDIYKYGDSGLKVAVEFTDSPAKTKPSDVYFAFNNPALNMITGKGGVWEMEVYPHLPFKYTPADIQMTYFIIFDNETLQCEIVYKNDCMFTYIHRKTTPLKNPDEDIIFSFEPDPRPNWNKRITHPTNQMTKLISDTFNDDSVFYQDNETGEIIRNYLNACKM